MRARRVGESALLFECGGHDEVAAVATWARRRAGAWGAVDVVPAARTVLISGVADPGAAVAEFETSFGAAGAGPGGGAPEPGALVVIPVSYGGPDLDEVARQWDLSTAEVIEEHTAQTHVVAFCGFAPGFAYCLGVGRATRRRADPRASVPPGSVGLAGEYTGVYPRSSPGGWQLIGSTRAELWRPDAQRPALLTPGAQVRFERV